MNGKRAFPTQDLFAFLFLVAVVLWFTDEIVRGGKVPFFRDLGPYFYPIRFSLAQSFKAGELPLWDRHMAMGFPLLADFQSGSFYPPHLFFLVLSFFTAIRTIFLFHYLVAATGSYMLCRQWNYPPYLAIIGAMLFTLGGTMVSLGNLLNHYQTAVWLPWVLLLGERSLRSPSWKNFLLFSSVLLVQFLAGSPEIYAMSLGLFFLDGMRFRAEGANITYRRLLSLLFAANALVAGLAMVQILPTVGLFQESRGHNTITYAENIRWSLHPLSLINLFFLDREVVPDAFNGLHLFFANEIPLIVSLYLGVIALPGIALWLLRSSSKEKAVLSGLIAISLVLAMGGYTPIYPFLVQYLPGLGLIRFPEKFFFITYALLLFVTLRGLFHFLQPHAATFRRALFALSSICLLLFLLYLLFRLERESLIRVLALSGRTSPLLTYTMETFSTILVYLERQIALTLGILLLLFLWKKERLRSAVFQVSLVSLVLVDLSSAHRPYQFVLDPNLVSQDSRIITAPEADPYRLFYLPYEGHLHPDFYPSKGRTYAEGVSSIFTNLLPNVGVMHGFDYVQELDALRRWPYDIFIQVASKLPAEGLYRLLGNLNTKYLISFETLPPGGITLVRHFEDYGSFLYRLNRVVPRVYIVSEATQENNFFKILGRLSSDEFHPLREVILDRPMPLPPNSDFQAQAQIVRYDNNRVAIRTSLNSPGVLVLTDSFYPGWRVYVDGNEDSILRANFFFRGVPLPAGEHLVEFRYQPRSFTIGLAISLITLLGVGLWSIPRIVLSKRALAPPSSERSF